MASWQELVAKGVAAGTESVKHPQPQFDHHAAQAPHDPHGAYDPQNPHGLPHTGYPVPGVPPDPLALLPWMDDVKPHATAAAPAATATAPAVDPAAKARESMAEMQATTYAMALAMNRGGTDRKQDRFQFLNILDKVDDPLVRAKMMEKFQQQTGQSLHDFIDKADWHGGRDKAQALDLISDKRGETEAKLAQMPPGERKQLAAKASGWAEQVLAVTRTDDANDDDNAQKIARVLGPRSPEEIEAIRAAIRTNTQGKHSIYEELDRSLSNGNEDEAVAGLSGDPVHAATVGLTNASKDPARIKEILRGLKPQQLAQLKQRQVMFGTHWIVGDTPPGVDRDEIQKLVAGDTAGADATHLTNLLKDPKDGFKMHGFELDPETKKNLEERDTSNVLREFESKSPAELNAARTAWNKEAATAGGKTWDQMIQDRFGDDDDATTRMRLMALAHGDRAEDKALALREGMRENDQQEIEAALANPDLTSSDPNKKAEAEKEKRAIGMKARAFDDRSARVTAMLTGKNPETAAGHDVDAQLEAHYREVETTDPQFDNPFETLKYQANRHHEKDKYVAEAKDNAVASSELWSTGALSTATQVYRAENRDDTLQEAKLLDGIKSNHELGDVAADFKHKYHKDMVQAPDLARFVVQAQMAKLKGDTRPIEDIQREMARDDMNANAMRIDNVREYGAKPERRADLESRLNHELYAKQHSDKFEQSEQRRAVWGNTGTEELAQDQLALQDSMLEPPKDPFGIVPRELKPDVGKDEFQQIDKNLTTTLEVQRAEKIEHSEHIAKIFTSIAKVAALVTMQPELILMLDVASGLGEMAIKKSIAGEGYDSSNDEKMLGITAAIDAATLGLSRVGKLGGALAAGEDAAQLGEQTAVKALEEGATAEAKTEIVQEGAVKAAGEATSVEQAVAAGAPTAGANAAADVTTVAEKEAGTATEAVDAAENHEAVTAEKLERPHDIEQQIDSATGVDKGPQYAQFKDDMKRFYENQEKEAANVTQVQQRRIEKKVGTRDYIQIDSKFEARSFSYDNANLTQTNVKVHLRPGTNVIDEDLAQIRENTLEGVDEYYNFGPNGRLHTLPNGNRLQVEVVFVEDPAAADLVVGVEQPGFYPGTTVNRRTVQNEWVLTEATPKTTAHEMGHQLGLVDEYVDPSVVNRATESSPYVFKDGSLMSNFHTDGVPTELKPRSVDQIGRDIERAGAGGSSPSTGVDAARRIPGNAPSEPGLESTISRSPRAPESEFDKGIAGHGERPAPGTRTETRVQYEARRSRERALESNELQNPDQPLDNPAPRAAAEGHGHGRHGYQTTDAQQARRVETGYYPHDPDYGPLRPGQRPAGRASRFSSPEAEVEALARSRRDLDAKLGADAQSASAAGTGPPTYADPATGIPERFTTTVTTYRPEGYGPAQVVRRDNSGTIWPDAEGNRVSVHDPQRNGSALVIWEYVPSADEWRTVSYYPEP